MVSAAIVFDVDGTLVDTNYLHVLAWRDAFRAAGEHPSMSEIHRHIGQGAERLVESVLGRPDQEIADSHTDFYGPNLYELRAFPGAADLLRTVAKNGLRVALATSASDKEAKHLRAALDADDVIDVMTTKDDVEGSKPDPDIVQAALDGLGVSARHALLVGDTVWDVEAGRRAGVDCVGVLSGGIGAAELRDAGAIAVFRDVVEILQCYDESPLAAMSTRE